MTRQTKEQHKEYMQNWRRNRKIKETQKEASGVFEEKLDYTIHDCLKFRRHYRGETKESIEWLKFHFSVCSDCRFWFREVRSQEKSKEKDSDLWKGVNLWRETESEETEEKLDANNRYLDDMMKRHGKA
jgi:hypothetical protein